MIAKLSLLESKREFLYNILLVSPCEYTTFRVYECVSIYAYMCVMVWSGQRTRHRQRSQ